MRGHWPPHLVCFCLSIAASDYADQFSKENNIDPATVAVTNRSTRYKWVCINGHNPVRWTAIAATRLRNHSVCPTCGR